MHRLTKAQLRKRKKRRYTTKPVRQFWRRYCKEILRHAV